MDGGPTGCGQEQGAKPGQGLKLAHEWSQGRAATQNGEEGKRVSLQVALKPERPMSYIPNLCSARYSVTRPTLSSAATSCTRCPDSMSCRACAIWGAESFGFLPNFTPRR